MSKVITKSGLDIFIPNRAVSFETKQMMGYYMGTTDSVSVTLSNDTFNSVSKLPLSKNIGNEMFAIVIISDDSDELIATSQERSLLICHSKVQEGMVHIHKRTLLQDFNIEDKEKLQAFIESNTGNANGIKQKVLVDIDGLEIITQDYNEIADKLSSFLNVSVTPLLALKSVGNSPISNLSHSIIVLDNKDLISLMRIELTEGDVSTCKPKEDVELTGIEKYFSEHKSL